MATSKSAWTRAEAGLARIFGARRRVLSGSANRSDIDTDDSTHDRLYLESKLREKHAVWSLFRQVKAAAQKCRKVPVLGLREKGRHGVLLVIHEDDLIPVIVEYLAACPEPDCIAVEQEVMRRRWIAREGNDAGTEP